MEPPEVNLAHLLEKLNIAFPVRFWFCDGENEVQAHLTKKGGWEAITLNEQIDPEDLLHSLDASKIWVLARGPEAATVTTQPLNRDRFSDEVVSLHHLRASYVVSHNPRVTTSAKEPPPPPIDLPKLYRELRHLSLQPYWRDVTKLLQMPAEDLCLRVEAEVPEFRRLLQEMQLMVKKPQKETITGPQFLQVVALLTNIITQV